MTAKKLTEEKRKIVEEAIRAGVKLIQDTIKALAKADREKQTK